MTPKKTQPPAVLPVSLEKRSIVDAAGVPKVVLLPKDETDVRTGIPVSLDLSPLFGHMPDSFQKTLYESLHAQGLIEPADYFKPGAAERFRAAMFTIIKHDFCSVQTIANEELSNGS